MIQRSDGTEAIVYYSRTGNTETVASAVESTAPDATVERIRPRQSRSYWNWLLRSSVPGSTVPIEPISVDLHRLDALFVGAPKWTLSCPPVNEFLDRAAFDGVPTGVFVTFGGFDEQRYVSSLADRVSARGADVRATLRVKRDRIGSERCHDAVEEFYHAVVDSR